MESSDRVDYLYGVEREGCKLYSKFFLTQEEAETFIGDKKGHCIVEFARNTSDYADGIVATPNVIPFDQRNSDRI